MTWTRSGPSAVSGVVGYHPSREQNPPSRLLESTVAESASVASAYAVPFLLELAGIEEAPTVDPHRYLKDLRAFVQRRKGDAILLREVNLPPDQQRDFFGDEDGDELNLVFNFSVMQRIYLALARRDAGPVEQVLGTCQACHSNRNGRRSCATTTNSPSTSSPATSEHAARLALFSGSRDSPELPGRTEAKS